MTTFTTSYDIGQTVRNAFEDVDSVEVFFNLSATGYEKLEAFCTGHNYLHVSDGVAAIERRIGEGGYLPGNSVEVEVGRDYFKKPILEFIHLEEADFDAEVHDHEGLAAEYLTGRGARFEAEQAEARQESDAVAAAEAEKQAANKQQRAHAASFDGSVADWLRSPFHPAPAAVIEAKNASGLSWAAFQKLA